MKRILEIYNKLDKNKISIVIYIIALPYAATTGDASSIAKAAVAGGSTGAFIGAGCPTP